MLTKLLLAAAVVVSVAFDPTVRNSPESFDLSESEKIIATDRLYVDLIACIAEAMAAEPVRPADPRELITELTIGVCGLRLQLLHTMRLNYFGSVQAERFFQQTLNTLVEDVLKRLSTTAGAGS